MNDTAIKKNCDNCYNRITQPISFCSNCNKTFSLFKPIGFESIDPTDSGKRDTFTTGAVREANDGKGRFDLISAEGLRRLALRYEFGSAKYGDRNWEKGLSTSNCLNSAFRHIVEYMMGLDNEDHLAACAWNLFAIMHYEKYNPDMQNIESRLKKAEV